MKKDLFEVLAEILGCMYISDLKYLKCKSAVLSAIEMISEDEFDTAQWSDAVNYFTGLSEKYDCPADAKAFLSNTFLHTK